MVTAGDPTNDAFHADGYTPFRASGHAIVDLGSGEFPLFVGYNDVRSAARDWRSFTSDTPFEVPIPPEHDVRPVRQLPIETDPPDHTDYRAVTAHFFSRHAADQHAPLIADVVDRMPKKHDGTSAGMLRVRNRPGDSPTISVKVRVNEPRLEKPTDMQTSVTD